MKKYLVLLIAVCLTVSMYGCVGLGKGKSKIVFTDGKGNPVILEQEVEGAPKEDKVK